MRVDSLCDTLSREGFFAEPPLDVVQHLRMCRVGLVQDVAQREVRRPQTVTEVLGEDPAAVCEGRLVSVMSYR